MLSYLKACLVLECLIYLLGFSLSMQQQTPWVVGVGTYYNSENLEKV